MSAAKLDDCVRALTKRLGMDRELQRDISQELKSHLEEAVEECKQAGMDEDESIESALKHFGSSEELVNQIWQANRGRIRIRSIIRWFLRVTLVPAALIFTVLYVLEPYLYSRTIIGAMKYQKATAPIWTSWVQERWLSEQDLFILYGDKTLTDNVARQESIAKRFPDDTVYYANYVNTYLNVHKKKIENKNSIEFTEILSMLDKGESLEPDNAFYNYLKASLMMEALSTLEDDPKHTFEIIDREGKIQTKTCYKVLINDRPMFEKGIKEYLRGNNKRFYNTHIFDMAERRLAIIRPTENLLELTHRVSIMAAELLPELSYNRAMFRCVWAYANVLVDEGRQEEVLPLLETMREPGRKIGGSSRTLIEILVARACQSIMLGNAQSIYERIGMAEKAETVKQEAVKENLLFNSFYGKRFYSEDEINKHGGAMVALLAPALMGFDLPLAPMRTLEQALFETGMVGYLLVVYCLLLVFCGLLTFWGLWSSRKKGNAPMLYFIGWKRLTEIVLVSLVIPFGLYVIYTRFMPFGGREYGSNYVFNRLSMEVVLFITIIFWSTLITAYRAIRGRALEAGLEVPESGYFRPGFIYKIVGGTLLLSLIIFFSAWEREVFRIGIPGKILIGIIVLASLCYFMCQLRRFCRLKAELALFRRTMIRSLAPILAFFVLFMGLTCHYSLKSLDKATIAVLNKPGTRIFLDELEYTAFRDYRDYLLKQKRAGSDNLKNSQSLP